MSDYSKEKFLELSPDRQVKVSLDQIYCLEKLWDIEEKKTLNLEKAINYLSWMNHSPVKDKLRIDYLLKTLHSKVTLRKILNVATALERHLNVSLKDDSIVVFKKDNFKNEVKLKPLYVVLDNLRSAFNVGSIFRTAECLGVSHIYLVGYTPTPEDLPVQKTAMGAEKLVSWSSFHKMSDVLKELEKKNIKMIGMETSDQSQDIYQAEVAPGVALFLGNERFGLEKDLLKKMDYILEIPMMGVKNSLNVGNAFAISASEILRKWSNL